MSQEISQDQESAILQEKSFPTKVDGDERLAGNSLGDKLGSASDNLASFQPILSSKKFCVFRRNIEVLNFYILLKNLKD